jgi:archaetidylinositol phosphate synthase
VHVVDYVYVSYMSHNTWIHRIAIVIVRPLVHSPVRPNHITAARLATGVAAALMFAWGTPGADWGGAIMFVLSMLMDRADGVLARLQGSMSPGGHLFDLVADALVNGLTFLGLGVGARYLGFGDWTILIGLEAACAVLTMLWMVSRIEARAGSGAIGLSSVAGFDPDDAMLVIPIVVVLGGKLWLIIVAAVGASLFALVFAGLRRKVLWGSRSRAVSRG